MKSIVPGQPKCLYSFLLCLSLIGLVVLSSHAGSIDDSFIAGYATAVLEREFHVSAACLGVKNGVITVRSKALKGIDRKRAMRMLSKIQGVVRVEILDHEEEPSEAPPARVPPRSEVTQEGEAVNVEISTPGPLFLPKGTLFDPLMVDPRWPHFSGSYQYYFDDEELGNVGAASLGGTLPLFRDNFPLVGQWQLGIQAAVFSIFDFDRNSDLINADYWVGIPLSYRGGPFSAILRVFHQSSHLGDEYLLRNPIERLDLSYEGVDLKLSLDVFAWLRMYGGGGYLFHRRPSDLEPWVVQAGLELYSPWTFLGDLIRPVAGADFQSLKEHDWDTDVSLRGGIQLESPKIVGHRAQLLLEYFRGHSPNGQFYERTIESGGIGLHFFF